MDDDSKTAGCRLKDPINIDNLMNEQPVEFSIRDSDLAGSEEEEEDTELGKVYKFEDYEPYIFVDSDSGEDEGDADYVAFSRLRKDMFPLRDDGKVMKMIVRTGQGENIPEDDGSTWFVYLHYTAHVEFGEIPFDCSYLRSTNPKLKRLGPYEGNLPGYDIAVRSMRKGEKARFLIHPDLMFKKQGAPPRIPPDATIHLTIELFDFVRDEKKRNPEVPLPPETLEEGIARAGRLREGGNKRKLGEDVMGAIKLYREGISLLLHFHTANADEKEAIKTELLKLYTNLALCYLSKKDYKRVCIAYNDAVQDCGEKVYGNAKLLYMSAKALRFLADYSEAKNRLRKAAILKPGDDDLLNELNALGEAIEKVKKDERNRAQRMMGFRIAPREDGNVEHNAIDDLLTSVSDDFKGIFLYYLFDFVKNSDENSLWLPFEHTQGELKYCERVCRERNVEIKVANDRMILYKRSL